MFPVSKLLKLKQALLLTKYSMMENKHFQRRPLTAWRKGLTVWTSGMKTSAVLLSRWGQDLVELCSNEGQVQRTLTGRSWMEIICGAFLFSCILRLLWL